MSKDGTIEKQAVHGRIDEHGKVLLPISLVASDGEEIEMEAAVNLEFDGSLAIPHAIAHEIGWRCLGARRVVYGNEVRLMDHYIGMVCVGSDPKNMVVLGGLHKNAVIGLRLLAGRKLTLNFAAGTVLLE